MKEQSSEAEQSPGKAFQEVEARALRLLGRREHSRLELWHKLSRKVTDQRILSEVLDHLENERWLDDARFADIYARQRMEMGYGPLRIRAELEQRGVHDEPQALAEVDEAEWCSRAASQRYRRFGVTVDMSWKEKGRQGRFLAQRGFSMGQIDAALGRAGEEPTGSGV